MGYVTDAAITARRLRALREARGWSPAAAVEQLRAHVAEELPAAAELLGAWQAWESGGTRPPSHYQSAIATALGTVTAALFPPDRPEHELTSADLDQVRARLARRAVDEATLDGVRLVVERLCTDYGRAPAEQLIGPSRQWLHRVLAARDTARRVEVLDLAGRLALLVGCLEYDLGDRVSAEASRRAAADIGREIGSGEIQGWAYEMLAWFALTSGDHLGVLAATEAGQAVAGQHSVAAQLLAQRAKALARLGRGRDMETALEQGRRLLDHLPYPANPRNHFVVDPAKYDFFVMDCYRRVGVDRRAAALAGEVIATDAGAGRSPMRLAEAHLTLGVAAARAGDLEQALAHGRTALGFERRSLPSLSMVAQDLVAVLAQRYPGEEAAAAYLAELSRCTAAGA
ncbi:hypothetical protein GCM10010174_73010 [Kutzneria viridogrisea]